MNIDRGLPWYSRLLNLALKIADDDEGTGSVLFVFFLFDKSNDNFQSYIWLIFFLDVTLDSNSVKPKNCVGTVVSLNGHRRYFCIYHARHPECVSDSGAKVFRGMAFRNF